MSIRILTLAGALIALTACSSITEGTSQVITVTTNPAGADCAFKRQGLVIGRVNPTPGNLKVDKTKHDITIECTKDGFQLASYFNKSDVAGMTAGNLILGGGIGWAIDSATGADNKYDSAVHMELVPVGATAPAKQDGNPAAGGDTKASPTS